MAQNFKICLDDLTPDYRQLAKEIGLKMALEIVALRGGEHIYIPSKKTVTKAARDRQIRADFSGGASYKDLARKYDLTVITVRKIIV